MQKRKISTKSLMARIETLRHRHRELDVRISAEHQRPAPDFSRITRLKQERLGLRDAIRMTQQILGRMRPAQGQAGWQSQFHSG